MTPWTVAYQAPLSMEFSRQEYWIGVPFSPPGDLPNPGIEPRSPALQADSLVCEPPRNNRKKIVIAIGSNMANMESRLLERPGLMNPSFQVCAVVH